ncbi:MAG: efflux RND transporter periplasmic adaptor subunit [Spirochaetes bacterium]|jgi:membrane fusion protein (multidrug efflux system)|nr:efflux RND transporter periplasmic adaptor subunit [Spirochaetota bacterium]
MKKMKRLKYLIVIIIVVLLLFVIVGRDDKNRLSTAPVVFSVRTRLVKRQDLHVYIETNGNIVPVKSVEVYPDIGGKLILMSVSLGSRVKKGQIIGYIDPSEPGAKYVKSPVIAPITGSVSSMPLEIGTTVSVNTPIAVIGDIDNLQITANIPERYVADLKPGLKADVHLEAYPDEIYHASVTRVSPVLDEVSRTKNLYLEFENYDSQIDAGMFPKIRLFTRIVPDCLVVPESSVITSLDEHHVFVVNSDNTVTKKTVKKGITVDGSTQIKSGLLDGQKIVVEGMQVLSDKALVHDVDAPIKVEEDVKSEKNSFWDKIKKFLGKDKKMPQKKETSEVTDESVKKNS